MVLGSIPKFAGICQAGVRVSPMEFKFSTAVMCASGCGFSRSMQPIHSLSINRPGKSGELHEESIHEVSGGTLGLPISPVRKGGSIQSKNFQVSAPSKRLTTTDSSSAGSKFRRFTPWRAPGVESIGSQWVTIPQVLHRTFRKDRSPQI